MRLGATHYNNEQKLPMTTLIVTLAAQPPATVAVMLDRWVLVKNPTP